MRDASWVGEGDTPKRGGVSGIFRCFRRMFRCLGGVV